jgi:hypothetical protein
LTTFAKAKAEVGIQVVQRWILARLRHEQFFSLEALNARIAELRAALSARKMRRYAASRRALFERLDQPDLRPLPAQPFVYGEWKVARVNVDSHIEVHGHYYSVPHRLLHEPVDVPSSATTVEVFHRGVRVASHAAATNGVGTRPSPSICPRRTSSTSSGPGPGSSSGRHASARRRGTWLPRSSPSGRTLNRPSLVSGTRAAGTPLWAGRVEAACARALAAGARSYRHVDAILKHGLDRVPLAAQQALALPAAEAHEHVRGPALLPHAVRGASRMLTTPTLDKLRAMKLDAMAKAWEAQQQDPAVAQLAFDERLGLLVDAERLARENRRMTHSLAQAKLKLSHACLEAVDFSARRGLDRSLVRQLATCRWVAEHQAVLIIGPTGVGKSFLACALAHQACRHGHRAR